MEGGKTAALQQSIIYCKYMPANYIMQHNNG